jgi:hypothetical protein
LVCCRESSKITGKLELGLRLRGIRRANNLPLLTRIRGDNRRFIVRANEKLTAFVELDSGIRAFSLPIVGGNRKKS